jgi:hypothetical protein
MLTLASLSGTKNLDSEALKAYMAWAYTWVTLYVLRVALFFKHEAYENEKEYRFLEYYGADVVPPNIKLRTQPYTLVRYREFDWRSSAAGALKEIVAGPSSDHEKGFQLARDCLSSFHPHGVLIIRFLIPYRAM